MELFNENEILVMIIVISLLLVIIIYLTFQDIKEERKRIKERKQYNTIKKNIEPVIIEESDEKPVTMIEPIVVDDEEEFKENSKVEKVDEPIKISPINNPIDKEQAREAIKRITEEIKVREMQNKEEEIISNFEQEQEDSAIISYDELVKVSNNLYDNNESMQYDDGNEPITIDEVIKMYYEEKNVAVINNSSEIKEEKTYKENKFQNTPFISPIYGVEEKTITNYENTANYEKMNRVTNQTNDFLNKLKDLQED